MKKTGQKAMEEHMNRFFTEWGFNTLYNYTKQLIKIYYKDTSYPFSMGIIMGIPAFNNTNRERIFQTKDELKGRIVGYMQLLCLTRIEVAMGADSILVFDITGDKDGRQ